jgi:hypothetical protein
LTNGEPLGYGLPDSSARRESGSREDTRAKELAEKSGEASMKKLMLFASLAMAASAFAVPSSASAVWTHNHAHLVGNAVIHGEGTAAFTSEIGGIHCAQVTATVQLTGGTTTAHTTQFTPNEATCKTTGGLAGCTITQITVENLPWIAHIEGTVINQTTVTITNHLHGFLCPTTLQLHTTTQDIVTLQPDETNLVGGHTTITNLTIGGKVLLTGPNGESLGTAQASGNIIATPSSSHTYGFT